MPTHVSYNTMVTEWENFQIWAIQPVNSQEAFNRMVFQESVKLIAKKKMVIILQLNFGFTQTCPELQRSMHSAN